MIRIGLTLFWVLVVSLTVARGAGVTIITHGLNSDADDWVLAMGQRIAVHPNFPGRNYSLYTLDVAPNFALSASRIGGVAPLASDSGEIIITLDWGLLANNSFSTYQVAAAVLPGLLQTNLIPELGGHALAEFPLHLIGHSRGGSLICELSRLLGTNGVWVDHLTTLDPHPLNNDGFVDAPLYTVVDASARTYENVLFHDNYYQVIDFFVYGEPVRGGYVRELTSLSGGYGGIGGAHSDVHLWYHATVDLRSTASDSVSSIGPTQRQSWWTAAERGGTNAGFLFSRSGDARRLGMPREGFNQRWDLGAGVSNNREPLQSNNGSWPNIIDLRLAGSSLTYFYQGPNANIAFCFDPDGNAINGNEQVFSQISVAATGPNNVGSNSVSVPAIGRNRIFARITGGGRTRFLYLPPAPRLTIARGPSINVTVTVLGRLGQTIALQNSPDLASWQSVATNTLTQTNWSVPLVPAGRLFHRAAAVP